jgi:hypothetical protein
VTRPNNGLELTKPATDGASQLNPVFDVRRPNGMD